MQKKMGRSWQKTSLGCEKNVCFTFTTLVSVFFSWQGFGLKMCFRVRYGKKENGTLPAHEKILDFKNLVLIAYSQDSSPCLLFLTLSTEFWFHILFYIKSQMNIPKIWCIPENEIKKCFKIYIYKIQKYLQVVTWQQKTQTKN